jgi:hypothetical protein
MPSSLAQDLQAQTLKPDLRNVIYEKSFRDISPTA